MALRDADELILPDVQRTIAALSSTTDADAGIVKLALRYAAVIDEAHTPTQRMYALKHLGPLLHAALEALGATPEIRSKGKDKAVSGGGQLAQLRAARRG